MRRSLVLLSAALMALAGAGCPTFSTQPGTQYACHSKQDCAGLKGTTCLGGVCSWPPDGGSGDGSVPPPPQCLGTGPCPNHPGYVCRTGRCVAPCDGGVSTCGPGEACQAGQCVPADGLQLSSCPPDFYKSALLDGGTVCGRACADGGDYQDCLPGWWCNGISVPPVPHPVCVLNLCDARGLGTCNVTPSGQGVPGQCVGPIPGLGSGDAGTGYCYPLGTVPVSVAAPYACRLDVPFGDGGTSCQRGGVGEASGYCTSVGAPDGGRVCRRVCLLPKASPCLNMPGTACYPVWGVNGVCVGQPAGNLGARGDRCQTAFSNATPPDQKECQAGLLCADTGDGGTRCEFPCDKDYPCFQGICTGLGLTGGLADLGYCHP